MIGLDEVGRGCFAGPLVVSAVSLNTTIDGLRDSKKLSAKRRATLLVEIEKKAESIGIAWVSPQKIDQVGLAEALKIAFVDAFSQITNDSRSKVIVDGSINYLAHLSNNSEAVPKADDTIPSVMAASIVAKEARDKYMSSIDSKHPNYGFAKNVGYGTQQHRTAIDDHGVCQEHRLSIKPLRKYAPNQRITS